MTLSHIQRAEAARMWANDATMKQIAHDIGVPIHVIKYEILTHRERYERRHKLRKKVGA